MGERFGRGGSRVDGWKILDRLLIRIFEELRALGFEGGYDVMRRYARRREQSAFQCDGECLRPADLGAGRAYQFYWSHEIDVQNGVTTTVNVAHIRFCHSRMMFVRAYRARRFRRPSRGGKFAPARRCCNSARDHYKPAHVRGMQGRKGSRRRSSSTEPAR